MTWKTVRNVTTLTGKTGDIVTREFGKRDVRHSLLEEDETKVGVVDGDKVAGTSMPRSAEYLSEDYTYTPPVVAGQVTHNGEDVTHEGEPVTHDA